MITRSTTAKVLLALAAGISMALPANGTNYTLTVNGGTKQGTVPHFWSRCVGTGGAQLSLDSRWKQHARMGMAEAGFMAFRGHRLLSASNPISWKGSGTPTYNWTTFDQIMDFYVDSLKTIPIVELSSMPKDLETSGEWSPPKDFAIWQDLIKNVVAHCESRYGQERVRTWLWEVWNEWDYSGFWSGGTEQKYYDLYKNAVLGAKGVDPQIKIGGPSTTGSGGLANFVNVCKSNNMEVDLLTNHCYGQSGSTESNPASIRNDNRNRSNAIKNSGKKLLSLNTEYSSSYSGQGGNTSAFCISMDSHVNAPFIAKCVKLILDDHTAGTAQIPDAISYWAISDVFDEGSWYASHSTTLFGQVFGLINQHGIPKAAFNAHRLLHKMGTTRLALTGGTGDNDGVDGFATVDSTNSVVTIMVYNFYKALGGQTAVDNVSLTVNSLPIANGNVEVRHYRIDSLHSNPYSVWLKANKPQSTNTSAMDQIRAAANLAEMYPAKTINYTGGAYTESFELPRQGMSLIVLKGNPTSIASGNQVPRSTPRVSFSNGIVKVASFDADDAATVSVFTTNGRLVRSTQISGQVAIRDLVPVRGIYLVRAKCGSIENASLVRVE